MFNSFDADDGLNLSFQLGILAVEAQMVVAMRLLGMVGLWNVSDTENHRMVSEKSDALMASGLAAGRALANGNSPAGAALAAVKPLRKHTKANVRRLSGRGPTLTA